MVFQNINKESTTTTKVYKVNMRILINKDARQGGIISPKLLIAESEEAFKNLEWEETGFKINEHLNNLRFADDIVLMNKSTDKLQQMILQLRTQRKPESSSEGEYEENKGNIQLLH